MNSNPPGPPPDAHGAAVSAPEDPIVQMVVAVADRLAACETDTAARFDAMRGAFADLQNKLRNCLESRPDSTFTDDPQRRLVNFLGYAPTLAQQIELFAAMAAWHATNPKLVENQWAEYRTKKGDLVTYGYANLAAVIATGQTAAPFGLCGFTRQEFDDMGQPIVTGYLVHSSGGAISSGPVPLFVGESERRGQAHAGGLTTCRRLALQMVYGLAADRDDDFNSSNETGPAPRQAVARPSGNSVATPPRRVPEATARPAATSRQGPPPGWLSREQRRALEEEFKDPALTPERFVEIEAKLQAAAGVSNSGGA
jgi:hypothetical protein